MKKRNNIVGKFSVLVGCTILMCCSCGKEDSSIMFASLEAETEMESGTLVMEEYSTEEELSCMTMETEIVSKDVIVYLCGAIQQTGVYTLPEGSRLYEAIIQAGGLDETAAQEAINQARLLVDGEQIYIPTKTEVEQGANQALNTTNVSLISSDSIVTEQENNGMINLNQATIDELTSLSGIGTNKAKAIIAYREEHGNLSSVEEVMNIDGIGEGIYQKIKDKIVVQ